jgi:hypothetical protein
MQSKFPETISCYRTLTDHMVLQLLHEQETWENAPSSYVTLHYLGDEAKFLTNLLVILTVLTTEYCTRGICR